MKGSMEKCALNFGKILISLLPLACASKSYTVEKSIASGNSAALKKDYKNAIFHYEQALTSFPNSINARRNLGMVLVKSGNYKKAKTLLSGLEESFSQDYEFFYYLGEANRGLEDFKSAIANYQKALRLKSNDLKSRKALSWALYKLGDYDTALKSILPFFKKYPNDIQIQLIVANTFNKLRRYDESQKLLSKFEINEFRVSNPDKDAASAERTLLMHTLAESYLGLGHCLKAQKIWSQVLQTRPFLSQALVGSARCDLAEKSKEKMAIVKLEKATRSDPESPEAHFLLGRIYERVDVARATFYYKRFLALVKGNSEFITEVHATKNSLNVLEKKSAMQ